MPRSISFIFFKQKLLIRTEGGLTIRGKVEIVMGEFFIAISNKDEIRTKEISQIRDLLIHFKKLLREQEKKAF